MVLEVAETEPCGGVVDVPGRLGPVIAVGDDLSDSDTSGLSETVRTSLSRLLSRFLEYLPSYLELFSYSSPWNE